MESAGMGSGWAVSKTADTGFACGRPATAILPKEEILLLIRCRSSNERFANETTKCGVDPTVVLLD